MPQVDDVIEIDVERGLVELDHIDADRRQIARLLVEHLGKGHRQRRAVAVMRVGDRIGDRHRPRQGEFEAPRRMRAGDQRLVGVDAVAPAQRAGDGRHVSLIAVVANADAHAAGEIDAVDACEKTVHEMLTRLLAVGDDVDAGILLNLQREQRRVALAFGERLAVEPPRGPQLARLGEPGRFRQTAGDRRFEHWFSQSLLFRFAALKMGRFGLREGR